MTTTKRYLTAVFIILIPFQDTFLQKTPLKVLGTSFSVVPLSLLMVLSLIGWFFCGRLKVPGAIVFCCCYALMLSLAYLALDGPVAFNNNLVVKSANLFVLTAMFGFVVYALPYHETNLLRRSTFTAFVITLLSIPLSDMHIFGGWLGSISLLHATENLDMRWRGFSSESSVFSMLIITLGLASAHLARRNFTKALCLAATILALIGCYSKGGILSLLLSIPIIAMLRMSGRWQRLLMILVVAPAAFLIYASLSYLFPSDLLSVSATLPTRISACIWGLLVFIHNPLGVGFSGFYPAIQKYMPEAIDIVSAKSPIPLNFIEVQNYAATGEYASSKILVLNYLVYFGIPFMLAALWEISRVVRLLIRSRRDILLAGLICVLIAVSTYVDSVVLYNIPLFLGICIFEGRRLEDSSCAERLSVPAESRRPRRYVGTSSSSVRARA